MERPLFVTPAKDGGWYLDVRVQPGAKKSELAGTFDNRLRIRLAAPAVDNKANKELVRFIGKLTGIRASKISIVYGDTGRQKRLLLVTEELDWSKLFLDKEQ